MSDETMTALERLQLRKAATDNSHWHWEDRELQEKCPQLFELLALRKSPEGDRFPGRLTMFVDEGHLKVGVFLPSEGLMAFVAVDRLSDIFQHLERLIVDDKLDWRRDKRNGKPTVGRF